MKIYKTGKSLSLKAVSGTSSLPLFNLEVEIKKLKTPQKLVIQIDQFGNNNTRVTCFIIKQNMCTDETFLSNGSFKIF